MAVFHLTKKWIMQVLLQAYPFLSLVGEKFLPSPGTQSQILQMLAKLRLLRAYKPVSVTSYLYRFTSEIAPGLNIAKELKHFSINSGAGQDPD